MDDIKWPRRQYMGASICFRDGWPTKQIKESDRRRQEACTLHRSESCTDPTARRSHHAALTPHSDAHSGTLLWRAARKQSLEHKVRLAPQGLVLRERGWALVQARDKRVGGGPADLTQSLASSSTPRLDASFARLTRAYCYLQRSAPLSHYISSRYTLSVATLFFCYC